MNARLKDLAIAGGIPLEKVQGLIDMLGGDEQWIESVLMNATKSEKAAMLAGVAYKADDAGGLDPLDQAYVQLRDAIEAGDPDGVQQALAQMAELAQSPPPPPATPVDVKARVLTDSGDQSVFSSASKAVADPWMTWFAGGAPAATKAFNPKTDLFALALGADQRGK